MKTSVQSEAWPAEDPLEIALAARVAMLAAASRSCILDGQSPAEEDVLDLIRRFTNVDKVEGRSFPDFLAAAIDQMRYAEKTLISDRIVVARTLDDVYGCEPRDVIGEIFGELVELASVTYNGVLSETLNVPLNRFVEFEGPKENGFHVAGGVPESRRYVALCLYARRFDLRSLALVPRILAHELICHIGARHSKPWLRPPDPDIRSFFSDGFMDCAAWRLLIQWIGTGALAGFTTAGHLSEAEGPYAARRPPVFEAGRGAWANCDAATKGRMLDGMAPSGGDVARLRGEAEDAVMRAALELNGAVVPIEPKDRFAYWARKGMNEAANLFVDLATGAATVSELLDEMREEVGSGS